MEIISYTDLEAKSKQNRIIQNIMISIHQKEIHNKNSSAVWQLHVYIPKVKLINQEVRFHGDTVAILLLLTIGLGRNTQ